MLLLQDIVSIIIYQGAIQIIISLIIPEYKQREMNNQQQPELTPQQKHEIWRKNSGYLYDRLLVHKMKWPSLTFQWLPTIKQSSSANGGVVYEVVLATHTSGRRQNQFIYILEVQFPNQKDLGDVTHTSNNTGSSASGLGLQPAKVKKIEEFRHQIQPNRVRYNENDPSLLAVRVDNAPIAIFKRGNQFPHALLSQPSFDAGFALQWSTHGLISGDHKGNIAIWPSIDEKPYKYQYKTQIQDTKFIEKNVFASAGQDGLLCVWDFRAPCPQNKVKVSDQGGIYTIAVNPVNPHLILTGGEEGVIKLWDSRNYSSKLYTFQGHQKSVLNIHWSSKTPTIFASASQDSKVKIWDLLRVGFQIPKDNSGTQQLLFTHEGHQDDVLDLSWNPYCMLLGSTQQKFNTLQIYEIVWLVKLYSGIGICGRYGLLKGAVPQLNN